MNDKISIRGVIKGFLSTPSFFGIPRILLAHEMGHFIMCRKYRVDATMPYFLPLPLPPFGTFGAVIKMKGHIPDKRALFDIGAAGPLMGLVFAIPAIIVGLILSDVRPMPDDSSHYLGLESLSFFHLSRSFYLERCLKEWTFIFIPLHLQAGRDYSSQR